MRHSESQKFTSNPSPSALILTVRGSAVLLYQLQRSRIFFTEDILTLLRAITNSLRTKNLDISAGGYLSLQQIERYVELRQDKNVKGVPK